MSNRNWPVIDESVAFSSNVGSTAPYPYWVSVVDRRIGQSKVTRGRQYELQLVQTGQYTATLDNRDGALTPMNTASPFSPITPYVPYRLRAQWPATANLLTQDQAAAGYAAKPSSGTTADSSIDWFTSYNSYVTITAEADAYYGPTVFQQQFSSVISSGPIWDVKGFSMQAQNPTTGATGWHSASCYARCTSGTAGSVPACGLGIVWRDINGNATTNLFSSPVSLPVNSRSWVRLTVSAQAPTTAVGANMQMWFSTPQICTLEYSGLQLEYSQTPSNWVLPGVWY